MRNIFCVAVVALLAACAASPDQFAQQRHAMSDSDICLALKTAEMSDSRAYLEMTRQEAASRGLDSQRCSRMVGERGQQSAQFSAAILTAAQRLQQGLGQGAQPASASPPRPSPDAQTGQRHTLPPVAYAGPDRQGDALSVDIAASEIFLGAPEEPRPISGTSPAPPDVRPSVVTVTSGSAESATPSNKRVALVIGNAHYRTRPLKNPVNDADDMSRALRASGFLVINIRNASVAQMRQAVRQFGERLLQSDVGLVYYSGHGLEVKGRNYFIPVNADIKKEDEVADQSLDVSSVLEKMETAKKSVNILIIDACRDDPFGRGFRALSRGLAAMEAPTGTIIAYSTSPGKVAADGDGRNSPYTKHLLSAMQAPGKPIEQVFKEVRRAVQKETRSAQVPWENTSLSGDFYFKTTR